MWKLQPGQRKKTASESTMLCVYLAMDTLKGNRAKAKRWRSVRERGIISLAWPGEASEEVTCEQT